MKSIRKPYRSDVSDEAWALVAGYLTLLPEDAGQREHSLRAVLNGLRHSIKTGAQWRQMPHDLPAGNGFAVLPSGGSPSAMVGGLPAGAALAGIGLL